MDTWYNIFKELISFIDGDTGRLVLIYKTIGAILISNLVWFMSLRALPAIENKTTKYKFFQVNDNIFSLIKTVLRYIIILVTGTYLINVLNIHLFEKIFYAVFVLLLAAPVKDFAKAFLEFLEKNIADKTETNVDDIIFDLLKKFSGLIVYVTGAIAALDILGINVMPFVAGAGVAGVAVGFAAKDTLSNLIAGILLIIDRPFEINDRIEVWSAPKDSSTWGDVIEIGLRATKIRTTDNIIIIIPNNEIMTRDIVNYTLNSTSIRVRINIGVGYNTDIAKAKELIAGVAKDISWVQQIPAPKVVVRNFADSAVNLQARVWISNAKKRMDTISCITDKVKEVFDNEGIEIPFPKRDVTIIKE